MFSFFFMISFCISFLLQFLFFLYTLLCSAISLVLLTTYYYFLFKYFLLKPDQFKWTLGKKTTQCYKTSGKNRVLCATLLQTFHLLQPLTTFLLFLHTYQWYPNKDCFRLFSFSVCRTVRRNCRPFILVLFIICMYL